MKEPTLVINNSAAPSVTRQLIKVWWLGGTLNTHTGDKPFSFLNYIGVSLGLRGIFGIVTECPDLSPLSIMHSVTLFCISLTTKRVVNAGVGQDFEVA